MTWFRGKPEPQADGHPGEEWPGAAKGEATTRPAEDSIESPPTSLEPYPQLNSVQQDEAIWFLKGRLEQVEKTFITMEKRLKDLEERP